MTTTTTTTTTPQTLSDLQSLPAIETINVSNFLDLLKSIKGTRAATISFGSEPKLNKGGRKGVPENPYIGRVTKVTMVSVMLGASYENMRRKVDPDFEAQPHSFADHVDGTPLMVKRDGSTYYLAIIPSVKIDDQGKRHFIRYDTQWYLDGQPVHKSMFAPWLPPKRDDSNYRNVKLDSIIEIAAFGRRFKVA